MLFHPNSHYPNENVINIVIMIKRLTMFPDGRGCASVVHTTGTGYVTWPADPETSLTMAILW